MSEAKKQITICSICRCSVREDRIGNHKSKVHKWNWIKCRNCNVFIRPDKWEKHKKKVHSVYRKDEDFIPIITIYTKGYCQALNQLRDYLSTKALTFTEVPIEQADESVLSDLKKWEEFLISVKSRHYEWSEEEEERAFLEKYWPLIVINIQQTIMLKGFSEKEFDDILMQTKWK